MRGEYTTRDVLRILSITEESFNACLRAALYPTEPSRRPQQFSFQDLLILKTAKGLCEAGISVSRIRKVLHSLKCQLSPDQSLATLRIYADGRRVVVWDRSGRWQPDSGQFLLNFEVENVAATRCFPVVVSSPPRSWTAEQWLERAMALEEESPDEARHAYEEALAQDPSLVTAHINLGLLHHRAGDSTRAEACYRAALHYDDPNTSLALFNLAILKEAQGDQGGAIEAYRGAIARDPGFQEAHRHLAAAYEATGCLADAIRHYAIARKLVKTNTSKK